MLLTFPLGHMCQNLMAPNEATEGGPDWALNQAASALRTWEKDQHRVFEEAETSNPSLALEQNTVPALFADGKEGCGPSAKAQ